MTGVGDRPPAAPGGYWPPNVAAPTDVPRSRVQSRRSLRKQNKNKMWGSIVALVLSTFIVLPLMRAHVYPRLFGSSDGPKKTEQEQRSDPADLPRQPAQVRTGLTFTAPEGWEAKQNLTYTFSLGFYWTSFADPDTTARDSVTEVPNRSNKTPAEWLAELAKVDSATITGTIASHRIAGLDAVTIGAAREEKGTVARYAAVAISGPDGSAEPFMLIVRVVGPADRPDVVQAEFEAVMDSIRLA